MARGENLATKATAGLERGVDPVVGPGRAWSGAWSIETGRGTRERRLPPARLPPPVHRTGQDPPPNARSGPSAEPLCPRSRRHDQRDRPAGSGPRLRPEQRGRLGRRDRPADVQGRRTFRRGRVATARDAVARPADAVRERRRRQHADADRCRARAAPARRSPSTIPTTSTSRSTGATRSSSPSVCTGSTSAGHTRSGSCER